ncbi:MAG TPA: hypothetical protein VGG49_08120 [Steroidobacteraceae bacterium]|jgi:hypothetical protein
MKKHTVKPAIPSVAAVALANATHAELVAYLKSKVEEQDWAAVSKTANDLNNLEILEARSMAPAKTNAATPSLASNS